MPESAAETLGTPQLQQAAQGFTEALHSGAAQGLMVEMGLNPRGPGVEPFLRALQERTDSQAAAASAVAPAAAAGLCRAWGLAGSWRVGEGWGCERSGLASATPPAHRC